MAGVASGPPGVTRARETLLGAIVPGRCAWLTAWIVVVIELRMAGRAGNEL